MRMACKAFVAKSTMLFGLSSGVALATVVGVLIQMHVMLLLVMICLRTCHRIRPVPVAP